MKARFWRKDWFVGGIVTALFIGAVGTAPLQGLERMVYDWGATAADASPSERVAVIAIDDESIANLGRWPWPRNLHGELIGQLAAGGADTIAYTVLFLEPQVDPGLSRIRDMLAYVEDSELQALPERIDDPALAERVQSGVAGIRERLVRAEAELATDRRLAEALSEAGNVVLGMPFRLGRPRGRPDEPLPEYVRANAIRAGALTSGPYVGLPARGALPPIADVGDAAAAIGHLNFNPDVDGAIRTQPLIVDHFGERYPAMSLVVATRALNLDVADVALRAEGGLALGGLEIGADRNQQMNMFFYRDGAGGEPPFSVDSFYDVVSGRIAPEKYRDKVVLVGATATGVGDTQVTPVSASMAPVMTLAHSVSSLLQEHFFTRPDWAQWARLGAFAAVALYLIVLVPRINGAVSAAIGAALLGGLVGGEYELLSTHQMWVPLAAPGALLVFGYMLMLTRRYLATERGKLRADAESAESNRMLGLSFQSQGQLDTAFEKYRKCPLDESMMEVLYNLGLDYERKRQFNKASNVYDYMARYDGSFRDIATRRKRAQAMEETVVLGGRAAGSGDTTLVLDDGEMEKPKLGRHDVEKEIGKGAMGTVYLGRDPKINRVVAIKTLALSQEYEADELEDVKQRFFREAETAGRLNHPNIVTVYDAGEEHDLAYIAMEYLEGSDLTQHVKKDALLPASQALEMVAICAEALAYAHDQGVVHRDIKPGNIVHDPESGTLKVTDFGIARITDSSRTKTGMVLGTPSYMSPEQVAGKKVDGRSDLYSLGVMLYQMLSGELPFTADSIATLMYKIANEEPAPLGKAGRGIPPCAARIVARAMKKDPEERYADGRSMATALRRCAAKTGGRE